MKTLEQRVAALEKKMKILLASKESKQYNSDMESMQQKGGKARADKLSPARRQEIAKKAAAARWKDRK